MCVLAGTTLEASARLFLITIPNLLPRLTRGWRVLSTLPFYPLPLVYTAAFTLRRLPRHATRDGQRRAPPPARVPGFSRCEDQRGSAGAERAPAGDQLDEHQRTAQSEPLPPRTPGGVVYRLAPRSLLRLIRGVLVRWSRLVLVGLSPPPLAFDYLTFCL